jgi:hypothetical protein
LLTEADGVIDLTDRLDFSTGTRWWSTLGADADVSAYAGAEPATTARTYVSNRWFDS